jgi:amidase
MRLLDRRRFLTSAGTLAASTALSATILRGARAASKIGDNGVHYRSARDLAASLAAREVSSAELVDLAIARIEARDGKLNSVVVRDFDRAKVAAVEADKALARGEKRPLLGVPMTVKESFNVAGLATTWGIPGTERIPVLEDAVAIARLKAAGAIVLGKTNVPLMLADKQSYNSIYGTTNNPWDPSRTPGGSSGGSAAALAAGYVSLELGTDLDGSLRVPASFCGVFAHKPTHGIVPLRGIVPPGTPSLLVPLRVDLAVAGPMARSADDLALALDVMAGPDGADALGYKLVLPAPRHANLGDFRVLVLNEHPLLPTAGTVRAALDEIANRLAKRGVKVARTSPLLPDLARIGRVFTQQLLAIVGADFPDDVYARRQSTAATLPADDVSLTAVGLRGSVMSYREWTRTDRIRTDIADGWHRLFHECDVVLCPVMPTSAFAHDHSDRDGRRMSIDGTEVAYWDQNMWNGIATLTGLPATAMPITVSDQGLPIGMQIVGPYLEDRTPLAFAALIEGEFGGFTPPPGYAG